MILTRKAPALKFEKIGRYFPVKFLYFDKTNKMPGFVLKHLYFAEKLKSEELYGNLVAVWRGPMDVDPHFNPDTTERINKEKRSFAVMGPDLIRIVADFPQIGNNLMLVCSLQNILIDMVARYLSENCDKKICIDESDIYVDEKKLNVGTVISCFSASQFITSINLTFKGRPKVPAGIKAICLKELLKKDEHEIIEDIKDIVKKWLVRIDEIQEKVCKTKELKIK